MTGDAIVVVPCFNEAERLDLRRFEQLTRSSEVRLLFVDDGSTDRTRSLLESLAARSDGAVEVLARDVNAGKAEAVRAGLLSAMERPRVAYVAYYDADLAAPPCELARVLDTLRGSADVDVAIGSRVAMLGRRIERSRWRHYQ